MNTFLAHRGDRLNLVWIRRDLSRMSDIGMPIVHDIDFDAIAQEDDKIGVKVVLELEVVV